ncbi:unnamed protein product [Notodromas monacha]|uniref:Uncharacterized protein n=1 Tax=Notodromas monacha TaxID=399045 RepID=A0A7R9BVB3_9CRUS|nr:unnamed protein product [Notodromas monacha]CAG0920892.1 unnamed protein product [Notodromas monacha]
MNLKVVDHPSFGFRSCNDDDRKFCHAHIGTETIVTNDAQVQSRDLQEAGVQTDEANKGRHVTYNEEEVSAFLNRVAPTILDALADNEKSTIFLDYEQRKIDESSDGTANWWSVGTGVVSSLDWNPRGTRIMIGISSGTHEDWCKHEGKFEVRNVSGELSTSCVVESCVTSVACHPFELSIMSIGTHDGRVDVWDLNRDNSVPMASSSEIVGTNIEEAVTCLKFSERNFLGEAGSAHLLLLISAALDGNILFWSVNHVSGDMRILQRFLSPFADSNPTTLGTAASRGLNAGILCWSFCRADPSTCLIGGEGGSAALCSFLPNQNQVGKNDDQVGSKNSVKLLLQSHVGNVISVDFCRSLTDVLATASSDGIVWIYNLKKSTSPVAELQLTSGITCLLWSPTAACVLFVASNQGSVLIFDLLMSKTEPASLLEVQSFPATGRSQRLNITTMKFNPQNPKQICIGFAEGKIAVWKLSELQVNGTSDQSTALDALGGATEEYIEP